MCEPSMAENGCNSHQCGYIVYNFYYVSGGTSSHRIVAPQQSCGNLRLHFIEKDYAPIVRAPVVVVVGTKGPQEYNWL